MSSFLFWNLILFHRNFVPDANWAYFGVQNFSGDPKADLFTHGLLNK